MYSCLLALGDVEEAQKGFEICLKSNHAASLDRKVIEEASDGLQKAQVGLSLVLYCRCSCYHNLRNCGICRISLYPFMLL